MLRLRSKVRYVRLPLPIGSVLVVLIISNQPVIVIALTPEQYDEEEDDVR